MLTKVMRLQVSWYTHHTHWAVA